MAAHWLAAQILWQSRRAESNLSQPAFLSQIQGQSYPDLVWVEPTYLINSAPVPQSSVMPQEAGALTAQIRMEQAQALCQTLQRAAIGKRWVVVIEQVEKLTNEAGNALLKLLEDRLHCTFIRWLNPVLDMFRRHWECRETIEGQMVLSLYFEYSSNIQKVFQQYQGEERQNLRAEKIEALMDQLLTDIEEVRLTAPERHYTSTEIISAVRRAIQNFCVDSNRRLVQLLGTKKKVSMFLEGHPSPVVVYHTNRNPENWQSPALTAAEMVAMAEKCFLMLAENDQARSKSRMDEKASDTYAPVSHAETRKARDSSLNDLELENEPAEALPFGLSFNTQPTEDGEDELAHLTITNPTVTDVLVGKGAVKQEFSVADLKRLPYVAVTVEAEQLKVVHRWGGLTSAVTSAASLLRIRVGKLARISEVG